MQVTVYDHTGKEVEKVSLPAAIFDLPFKSDLVHRALVRELSNARQGTKKTKKRGEVSGGGKKPRPQKGSGRARQGSTRSPQWVGGGIVFGPTGKENYTKKMNRKEVRYALYCTLAKQASEGRILGLNEYPYTESKTKQFSQMLQKLPVERDVLLVLPAQNLLIEKAARNLPQVKITTSSYISIADLLKHDKILCLQGVFAQWNRLAEGQSLVAPIERAEEEPTGEGKQTDGLKEELPVPATKPATKARAKAKATKAAKASAGTTTATTVIKKARTTSKR